jgi:hypothetical protein
VFIYKIPLLLKKIQPQIITRERLETLNIATTLNFPESSNLYALSVIHSMTWK